MACPLCGLKDWHLYCCRTQRRLCCWEKTLKCCNSIFFFVILLCCINRLVSVLQSLPLSQVWDIKQRFSEEFKSRSVSIYTDSWNEKKNWVSVKKNLSVAAPDPHTRSTSPVLALVWGAGWQLIPSAEVRSAVTRHKVITTQREARQAEHVACTSCAFILPEQCD